MAGRVIRQNVCHPEAPRVAAACSCSSPISWSTGSTSRTTKGMVTKIVASTMPGSPKMTLKPRASTPPNQPPTPHSRIRATPTTMGDTAKGRSTTACSTARPGNRPRTRARATVIPKTTLAGRAVSICSRMYCDATWVTAEMFTPMRTTEPYSPIARANASPPPLRIAGVSVGSRTRRKIVQLLAPSDAAASSTSRSASMRTGCTARTTNGSVTKARATASPAVVALRCTPTGLFGPYSDSSTMLATMVGRANGRSISAFTRLLPRKSSRTRTQAISVPMSTLNRATTADVPSVTRRAASAAGAVTASQNSPRPPDRAVNVSAASGSSTMMLSQSTDTPIARGPTVPVTRRIRAGRSTLSGAGGAGAVVTLMTSLRGGVVDHRDGPGVLGEEGLVDGLPATEVGDRPELGRRREAGRVLLGHRLVHRAEPGLGQQGLRRRRVEVVVERLGCGEVGAGLDHGERVLDLERRRRGDVLDGVAAALEEDRLVLVTDQGVAGPLEEGVAGLTAGFRLGRDVVLDQGADVVQAGLGVGAAVALRRVRRQQVPLRRAGAERVRRDDVDPRLEQVVPVLDPLRVALADHDGHDRAERDSLLRARVPACVDQSGVDQPGHVGLDGEVH